MNVTLSAQEFLIEKARMVAKSRHTSLNAAFQAWLVEYTSKATDAGDFDALMNRMGQNRVGRTSFSRDEMNEREQRPLTSVQIAGNRR